MRHVLLILCALAVFARGDDITTRDGTTYKDAVITSVDPASVGITHASGIVRVSRADLPPELQAKYPYDAAKAATHQRAEEQAQAERRAQAQRELAEQEARRPVTEEELKAIGAEHVSGKILQHTPEGLLLVREETIFLLRNVSNADELHDDTYMNIWAVPQPQTFPYLTATGATKAIKVYVATNKQP